MRESGRKKKREKRGMKMRDSGRKKKRERKMA
jgi:hypothetical protein